MGATIKDIAKSTGLSLGTISKFINGGTVLEKNKIIIRQAIEKMDFKVNELARGLKTSKTMTIGVLIPSLENIFCTCVVSNIENILLKKGYSTIICDYQDNSLLEKEKLNFLMNKRVDGIIIVPLSEIKEEIEKILQSKIPIILIDRMLESSLCDMVLVDNLNASYEAVEHLIVNEHKRIGIISGPKEVYTAQERLKGYVRVHEDYSMSIDDELVKYGDYKLESGYEKLIEFLAMDSPPTAVYVTNYYMTLGAMIAINEKNLRIPEDLSIIGFDNLEMARIFKPALSIVVQPMKQIAETSANLLLKRLSGDYNGFPHIERLKAKVLLQQSVKSLI